MSKKVIDIAAKLLANSYFIYLKTQNFHWNITGELFYPLHKLFEAQYNELATSIDEIAECIRTFGARAPGSFQEFSRLATIKESTQNMPAKNMVQELAHDHNSIIKFIEDNIKQTDKHYALTDLLTQRLAAHQKMLWMLQSTLLNESR